MSVLAIAISILGLSANIARSSDLVGTSSKPIAAGAIVAPTPEALGNVGTSLPRISLSGEGGIWGMIKATDAVVRSVMMILLLSSISTWTVWLVTVTELIGGCRRLTRDIVDLRKADSLAGLSQFSSEAVTLMIDAIRSELRRSGDLRNPIAADGLKERASAYLLSLETMFGRRMSRTTVIIASVGATAPFIGLFGTVWGIMDSFIGINRTQNTNLAAIAPGIAEALLTTALGLAAAIPAVLIYNGLARAITGYRALLADASNASMCVLSLDVERRQIGGAVERPVPLREVTHGL